MSKDTLGVKDVKGVLVDLLEKLGGDDSFAWFTELKKFLRKEPCWIKNEQELFNPHEYFVSRSGLWISDDAVARDVLYGLPCSMTRRKLHAVSTYCLGRNMTDAEIIGKKGGEDLVRTHAFTFDQIAALIDLQKNGEGGKLLNNGFANIFHVVACEDLFVASVLWFQGNKRWDVTVWPIGKIPYWEAETLLFSYFDTSKLDFRF